MAGVSIQNILKKALVESSWFVIYMLNSIEATPDLQGTCAL